VEVDDAGPHVFWELDAQLLKGLAHRCVQRRLPRADCTASGPARISMRHDPAAPPGSAQRSALCAVCAAVCFQSLTARPSNGPRFFYFAIMKELWWVLLLQSGAA
jgi:hypothetical protein